MLQFTKRKQEHEKKTQRDKKKVFFGKANNIH